MQQGATYSVTATWSTADGTAVDLQGYTASVRIGAGGNAAVTLTQGSGITLGGAAGTIQIVVSATQTSGLTVSTANRWELDLTAGDGTVTRLLSGSVYLGLKMT